MLVKLQTLHPISSFHKLQAVKTSPTATGVSVSSPTEKLERPPINQQKAPLKVAKNSNSVNNRHVKRGTVTQNPILTHNCCGVKLNSSDVDDGVVETVHTNCSTKWVHRHGVVETRQVKRSKKRVRRRWCIPAMLETLDEVSDLDEAFKPWEERLSSKEMTIVLNEQGNWERAMEIFEWFKKKGCYEVNVIHYNVMIRILGKSCRWGELERLWAEMERRRVMPDNATFGTLIDVYSKGGFRTRAIQWLELMSELKMEPDEVTMSIVVQVYKKAGDFEKAEEFFRKWLSRNCEVGAVINAKPTKVEALNGDSSAHVCLSLSTYNTLIDMYGKAGRLKEVSDTFGRMLRERIVPNTVTFNTLIHIFGNHGRLEEIGSLLLNMEQLKCQPDTRTYATLIFLQAKRNNMEKAADYFRKMKADSLEPNPVCYRTLLYAFSIRHMVAEAEELVNEMDSKSLEIDEFMQSSLTRMYIESGMIEKSWSWFNRFHLKGHTSSLCYSAIIDAFGERGRVLEAEKVFRCCQEGRKLSVIEFNVMIKAYGINKRYDEACHLVDSMEKYGVSPDKCSYSSLIQILASADRPKTAMSYVRKMQEAGLVSDCIVYCAVISSFVKLGRLGMAVGVLKEMNGFNVQPDVVVYGVLIKAYADIGNVEEALSYVDAMKLCGLSLNDVIYKSLIKLYTKVGHLKEAEQAYHMLQKLDMGPDVYSSNCLIDLYTEKSMVIPAEEIFENLKTTGHANEFSYAMMLCLYKKIGWFKKAIRIAQNMRELGLLTNLLSYNHVLWLYATDGRFKEAVATFNEMMEHSIQPDDSTFRALGVILVKHGIPKQVIGKLEIMWKRDNQSGIQAWMTTLSSVLGV